MIIKRNFGMADSADHRSGGPGIAQALRDVADDLEGARAFFNEGVNLLSPPNMIPLAGTESRARSFKAVFFLRSGVLDAQWDWTQYVPTAAINTGAGEYRKVLITIDPETAYTDSTFGEAVGEVAASQEVAQLPAAPEGKVGVAYAEIPPNFTAGTSVFTEEMLKNTPEAAAGFSDMPAIKTVKG